MQSDRQGKWGAQGIISSVTLKPLILKAAQGATLIWFTIRFREWRGSSRDSYFALHPHSPFFRGWTDKMGIPPVPKNVSPNCTFRSQGSNLGRGPWVHHDWNSDPNSIYHLFDFTQGSAIRKIIFKRGRLYNTAKNVRLCKQGKERTKVVLMFKILPEPTEKPQFSIPAETLMCSLHPIPDGFIRVTQSGT